jgi:hypothetical protein
VRQRRADEAQRAVQGAVDGGLPAAVVEVVERAGLRAPGVHEQQVETAEGLDRPVDGGRGSVGGAEVGGRGDRSREPHDGLLQACGRTSRQRDPGALARQRGADRQAQATRSAGDKGARSIETQFHAAAPPERRWYATAQRQTGPP